MIDIAQSILLLFKNNPAQEYDTSQIAKSLFPEYTHIEQALASADKEITKDAKYKKFQLHRKLLYYINKLVKDNVLKISSIREKGEKAFMLAIEEGNITLEKGYKKITISKPPIAKSTIEHYEQKNIMKRYDENSWITKINALMIECSRVGSIEKLTSIIKETLSSVNDVIALNDFEQMLGYDLKEWLDVQQKIMSEQDKTLCLLITISASKDEKLKEFILHYAALNPKHVNIAFQTTTKDMQRNAALWTTIISEFSRQKIKINIKNSDLSKPPIIKGRAGMYSFDDDEYTEYLKNMKGKMIGVCISQSTIAVSVNRFFEENTSDMAFRKILLEAAKTLLYANALQRRKSGEYFRTIMLLNAPESHEFFKMSRNYIRFWNYDWHKSVEQNDTLYRLLKSSKEEIDRFCFSEEAIFKSCGIPIRFRIAFSSAFRNFNPTFMGERDYKKTTVKKIEEYYKGEIKSFIEAREKLCEVFDGSDRLRIFRTMDFTPQDIMHEWSVLLSTFKIPFFTYDFSGLQGMIKLTNFM